MIAPRAAKSLPRSRTAVLIGALAALISALLHIWLPGLLSDISIPHCGAGAILQGLNPYACQTEGYPSNPLPTILALVPLAGLPIEAASAILNGLSAGVLAYGLLHDGKPWRLVAFLSFPYVYSLIVTQWAPLLLAAALLPRLYLAWLLKPHLGWPMAVLHFSWRRAALTAAILLLTLLAFPDWPEQWLAQTRNYSGFVPIALLPFGPLLLFGLVFWRDTQARWLLLLSCAPQRLWYDQLLLWIIPQTPRDMSLLTLASWGMVLPVRLGLGFHPLGPLVAAYLPCLIIVTAPKIRQWVETLGRNQG
jgi:hypothetical protein